MSSQQESQSDSTWSENISEASDDGKLDREWPAQNEGRSFSESQRQHIKEKVDKFVEKAETSFSGETPISDVCKEYSKDVTQLIADVFAVATENRNVSESGYAFCVSGSLARQDATLYSDLDFYVLIENEEKIRAFKNAVKDLKDWLSDVIKEKQLNFDFGTKISLPNTPKDMVTEISSQIVSKDDDERGEGEFLVYFLLSSEVVGGTKNDLHGDLLEYLKNLVYHDTQTQGLAIIQRSYLDCMWRSEDDDSDDGRLNIKAYFGHPIVFIAFGLSFINSIDGLVVPEQALALLSKQLISQAVYDSLIEGHNMYLKLRFQRGKKRYYDMPVNDEIEKLAKIVMGLQLKAKEFYGNGGTNNTFLQ